MLAPLPLDLQAPWLHEPSIIDRALCTPTAHAMQLQHLHIVGVVQQVPTGTPYAVGALHDWGFHEFGYGPYPRIMATTFAQAAWYHPLQQPGFGWWMNTNNMGASDVPGPSSIGASRGTVLTAATVGATRFYDRTPMAGRTGFAYHTAGAASVSGRVPFSAPSDEAVVWAGLKATVDANRAVVLYLDGWALSSLGAATSDSVSLFALNAWAPTNGELEEDYMTNNETPGSSIGHTVLAVGYSEFNGCRWVAVHDVDPTTPRLGALPWQSAGCGGARGVWDALVASFFVEAP